MLPLYVPQVGDCVIVSTPPKCFTKITEATASRRRFWLIKSAGQNKGDTLGNSSAQIHHALRCGINRFRHETIL